jgi:hypothetical protein
MLYQQDASYNELIDSCPFNPTYIPLLSPVYILLYHVYAVRSVNHYSTIRSICIMHSFHLVT